MPTSPNFATGVAIAAAAPPLATAVARYFAPEVFGGLRAAERPPHDKDRTYERADQSLLRKLVR